LLQVLCGSEEVRFSLNKNSWFITHGITLKLESLGVNVVSSEYVSCVCCRYSQQQNSPDDGDDEYEDDEDDEDEIETDDNVDAEDDDCAPDVRASLYADRHADGQDSPVILDVHSDLQFSYENTQNK